jgi:flagellar biosynthesis component FlhA
VLSGTPTTAGSSSFTVRATDASGSLCTGTAAYTLIVASVVPTMPETFFILLALMLGGFGYLRLRRLPRTE